eukprot:2388831-Pleurochrysis_carterae.AAC.1
MLPPKPRRGTSDPLDSSVRPTRLAPCSPPPRNAQGGWRMGEFFARWLARWCGHRARPLRAQMGSFPTNSRCTPLRRGSVVPTRPTSPGKITCASKLATLINTGS